MKINKISVIGNACSGKTTYSRILAKKYDLPLTHVDTLQFLPGMKLRDPQETIKALEEISNQDKWIIDGLGPLRIIEDRFRKSDQIIMIRIPLWKNYWWCAKRQFKGLFFRRPELPPGCFEATPSQTLKLITTIWNVHFKLWPQLDRILAQNEYKDKVIQLSPT